MGMGAGSGNLFFALVPLIGIVTMVRARARRKRGDPEPEETAIAARLAATRETERRMKAYLAQRQSDRYETVKAEDVQETKR
ncbi:MAG TPA: hypothetical protein PKA03_01815 [Tabrizicola sp.]|nr:hypothetical protein [Tabrizicola sp.]